MINLILGDVTNFLLIGYGVLAIIHNYFTS
jgi:hypothetical protein